MEGNWLGHSLVSRSIWELITIFGGAAVISWLKDHKETIGKRVTNGIVAAACLGVIIFTLTGQAVFSKSLPQTDANNVEENVKTWISALGLAYQPISVPDTNFSYKVTLPSGSSFAVSRYAKQRVGYLMFEGSVTLAPEHKAELAALSDQDAVSVTQEIALDLAKVGIGQRFNESDYKHLESITLAKAVPISSLSESSFASYLDEMDSASLIVKASVPLALDKYGHREKIQKK